MCSDIRHGPDDVSATSFRTHDDVTFTREKCLRGDGRMDRTADEMPEANRRAGQEALC